MTPTTRLIQRTPDDAADPAAQAAEPVLSVRGLTTSFRRETSWQPVVRDLSFDIAPGETLAIVGESGSGKSVTALSIMRLVPSPSGRIEGSVKLGGRELLTLPDAGIRQVRGNEISMIFQEPMTSLNPVLSIGFQIAETLRCHRGLSRGEARTEAIRLLDRVRIPAAHTRIDDYPHQFSGGMRQRVMIAMALACRPRLLIADEPTTALDVTIQAQILNLVREVQHEFAMSVLFITHDMGVVAEISDRTLVMYRGQGVESGTTAQALSAPRHAYTKALLSAVPLLGSMAGTSRPQRFAIVDTATGLAEQPAQMPDTVVRASPPLLEVDGLTTRFDIRSGALGRLSGRVHAVENISFALERGETLSLVGESGCGKTTVGRSIVRLIEPSRGSIRLAGEEILKLSPHALREARKQMQIIFQDPFASLNPRQAVGSAVAEPIVAHGLASRSEAADRVADLFRQVGLAPDLASRFPHEFSGGQRQRICIARALALEPQLIVADESVSALDASIKAQIVNLMLDLQERLGLSFLFISHDIAIVERVSHRVAVMYLGEIVEIGAREAIFGNPQHPYTRKLMAAVPIPDPRRRTRDWSVPDGEIRSPVRALDYVPPVREYREVEPGHLVLVDNS